MPGSTESVAKSLKETWQRARGGEGALAPSCRVPHGHDQIPGELFFPFFFPICGCRNPTKTCTRDTSSKTFVFCSIPRLFVYLQMRLSTSKQHSCVRGLLREYCSNQSGASGLPYYCTPLVCISAVIGLLAVWRHNKPKTKNQKPKDATCPCTTASSNLSCFV